jgi:hypothetical protein
VSDSVLVLRAEELRSGDRLVLRTEQAISAEQAAELKAQLAAKFPEIRADDVVVLSGCDLQVIRPAEQ